jgi:hypothetical protein
MMGMFVVMMRASGERAKNTIHLLERDIFPGQKLQHGGISRDAHAVGADLDAEVEIAKIPSDTRGLLQSTDRNFKHLLGKLFEYVMDVAIHEKGHAVGQRLIEIEPEFLPVPCDSAPASFRERGTIHLQLYLMMSVKAVDVR